MKWGTETWWCLGSTSLWEGNWARNVTDLTNFTIVAGLWGPPARFRDIFSTIRQVFARDVRADQHFLFAGITLPSSKAIRSFLAASPAKRKAIHIPVPLIQAWLWALKNTPTYILATQSIWVGWVYVKGWAWYQGHQEAGLKLECLFPKLVLSVKACFMTSMSSILLFQWSLLD